MISVRYLFWIQLNNELIIHSDFRYKTVSKNHKGHHCYLLVKSNWPLLP